MDIRDLIDSAEIKYRRILEEFFSSLWGETTLYSHDINHHRRVWQYVKEILLLQPDKEDEPEKLLMASYFHDLGMVSEPGFRHGARGRELFAEFLRTRNLFPDDFADVLEAIEHHDDKEYRNYAVDHNRILKILSVADDLDAFGYAGIYRYLEIYIARGISLTNVGHEIRENADSRFRNFRKGFRKYPEFFSRHRKRYHIIDSFMSAYNAQIGDSHADDYNENMEYQIVSMVSEMVKRGINPSGIKELCHDPGIRPGIRDFLDRLDNELNQHK